MRSLIYVSVVHKKHGTGFSYALKMHICRGKCSEQTPTKKFAVVILVNINNAQNHFRW